jgi:hypothetical protein
MNANSVKLNYLSSNKTLGVFNATCVISYVVLQKFLKHGWGINDMWILFEL